jgi:hypothetical protein
MHVWWEYVIIAAVLVLGVYSFKVLTNFQTRQLSRKSTRSAESIYRNYADPEGERRRRSGTGSS